MSKLFYSQENNTQFLNMGSQSASDSETVSVDVYDQSETDLLLTDIEDHQNAAEEGVVYTDIMMESYNAISKEAVGSDSYKAVCSLSQRILLALPARLNLKRSLSMPSIEDVNYRYDVYDRIAKESIFEGIKKAIKKVWDMIIGVFTSILNFFKRLLGIEIKKKEEERKAIQDRINEILKNKNQYKSVGGTYTGKHFAQTLGMTKEDIVKQGNITNLLLKLKDRINYSSAKSAISKLDEFKEIKYYDALARFANSLTAPGAALTEKGFLDEISSIYNIKIEIAYSTVLVNESKLIIDTKQFSNSDKSYSAYDEILSGIDSSKVIKFESKLEDSEISLDQDIDNINKLNDLFSHVTIETKSLFDEGSKTSENLIKMLTSISEHSKENLTKAAALNPSHFSVDYIKSAINFMNKFHTTIYSQEGVIAASITKELKFMNDFGSELSSYLNDCLDAFKPAN